MKISCDTIARLSNLLPSPTAEIEPIFRTIRLENGKAIVTDRKFLAVEQIEPFQGVFHIRIDPPLLEQCKIESQFSSYLDITPNEALRYTMAVTTMGFTVAENIGVWPDGQTEFDRWRQVTVDNVLNADGSARGHMVWDAEGVAKLAAAAPSGFVSFEVNIDTTRAMVIRDINSPDWCGFFVPKYNDGLHHSPATVPEWCK